MTKLSSTVQQALAAAERIFEILDVKNHIQEKKTLVIEDIKGSVKFEGVFAYKENEEVLEDINLEVNPGEVVALVGPSGAGKTTLVDLLFRFYDPDRGKIYIDEIDIKEISLASLRKHIGIVPQKLSSLAEA